MKNKKNKLEFIIIIRASRAPLSFFLYMIIYIICLKLIITIYTSLTPLKTSKREEKRRRKREFLLVVVVIARKHI